MAVNVGSNKSFILKDKTAALVTMIKTLKYVSAFSLCKRATHKARPKTTLSTD